MKELFSEYHKLSAADTKSVWNDSLIVFDTNVLLNLYRYTDSTRNEYIEAIKRYKDRLWMPYQVALEFNRNRASVIIGNETAYDSLIAKLESKFEAAIKELKLEKDYARHPRIDIDDIKERINKCKDEIIKSLKDKKESSPNYLKDEDDIFNTINECFKDKIGTDFTEEELNKLYKLGADRYKQKVPPGYCDEPEKKDEGLRRLYGDLIVWKQVINKSKETKANIIFVTNDDKEDWWLIKSGRTISPRPELIKEFKTETENLILIYNGLSFLKLAKQYNDEVKVSKETIDEITKVKREDESRRNTSNYYVTVDKDGRLVVGNPNDKIPASLFSDSILGTNLNHVSSVTPSYMRDIGTSRHISAVPDYLGGITTNPLVDTTPNYLQINEPYNYLKGITEPDSMVTSIWDKERKRIKELINPKPYNFIDPEGLLGRTNSVDTPMTIKIPGLDKDL